MAVTSVQSRITILRERTHAALVYDLRTFLLAFRNSSRSVCSRYQEVNKQARCYNDLPTKIQLQGKSCCCSVFDSWKWESCPKKALPVVFLFSIVANAKNKITSVGKNVWLRDLSQGQRRVQNHSSQGIFPVNVKLYLSLIASGKSYNSKQILMIWIWKVTKWNINNHHHPQPWNNYAPWIAP